MHAPALGAAGDRARRRAPPARPGRRCPGSTISTSGPPITMQFVCVAGASVGVAPGTSTKPGAPRCAARARRAPRAASPAPSPHVVARPRRDAPRARAACTSAGAASSARLPRQRASASPGAIHSPPWSSPDRDARDLAVGQLAEEELRVEPARRERRRHPAPGGHEVRGRRSRGRSAARKSASDRSSASSAARASSRRPAARGARRGRAARRVSSNVSRTAAGDHRGARRVVDARDRRRARSARATRPPGNAWKPPRNASSSRALHPVDLEPGRAPPQDDGGGERDGRAWRGSGHGPF